MNTATTAYCQFNHPPPTYNTLDSRQKTRLIRTTRKLGAVLGTTPHLAESDSPVFVSPDRERPLPFSSKRDRKRRQGSIFEFLPPSGPFAYDDASSSASSSMSELALPRSSIESNDSDLSTQSLPAPKSFARHVRERSKSKGKCMPLPTPLVLRLNAVALPLSDPRLATPDTVATLKSISTATRSAIPVTPTTPVTPSTPTVTETRRRRLAKLKRTLGENVPAELVMPFRTPRAQRPSPVAITSAAQTLSSPRLGSAPYKPANADSQKQRSPRAKPLSPSQKTDPLVHSCARSTSSKDSPRRRSASVDFKHGVMSPALAAPSAPQPPSKSYHHSRAPSHAANMFTSETYPPVAYSVTTVPRDPVPSPDSGRVWVTGAESWTGEWNRKDIREVQRQLRNLRLR
ncbi:hypothetical protein BD311DRAFT_124617 [Dichomitus squalens]|uniref:Uncharacterized protein n=1 Tax=Dichomitus squalens TaxID=114155 RepID=A0A4Q9M6Z8_9APHY|nr:hypothetical protein BD311DRAFT_124617 [Dichomitus squalens]